MKKLILTLFASIIIHPLIIAKSVVAVYDIDSPISEGGQTSPSLFNLSERARPLTQFDILQSLEKAIHDKDLKAVVLDIDNAGLSLAQIQEIRTLLLQLREANKDVWIYTESLSASTALLGSAANHMTLMPQGNITLNGLYGESMYFKHLLDKIGVKVEVIHIGDFKSAGEIFYRDSPSKPAKAQQDALLDSLYAQIIQQIAEGRKILPEELTAVVDKGLITPKQALDSKLVDHLEYRTDFIKNIRAQYGKGTKYHRHYAMPNPNGPEISGIFDLFKLMLNSEKKNQGLSPYIAVIALEGNITDASIAPVRLQILKATRDAMCKALVLRVNSPGGSALASDVLWEATAEFKATGRPFVVSMGDVAASGGYYVSAAADTIFAQPGTITGSIGVVGMKIVLGDALQKLGISTHASKRGKHADILNTSRSYTTDEEKIVRDSMLDVYATFKNRITDGRGDRLQGDLESLAGGRVYSGADALKVGLVDKLGNLNAAITHAAELAKMKHCPPLLLPEPKSPIEGFFAQPEEDKHEFIQAATAHPSPLLSLRQQMLQQQYLGLLGTEKLRQIENFLIQIESIQSQRILLLAPALPAF